MSNTWRACLCCTMVGSAMALGASGSAVALGRPDEGTIRFRAEDAKVRLLRTAQDRASAIRGLVFPHRSRHIVVQFNGPLMPAQRDMLARSGLSLQAPLGGYSHFATLAPAAEVRVDDLAAFGALRAVEPIRRPWKLHPLLLQDHPIEWAVAPGPDGQRDGADPIVAVYIVLHPDEPMGHRAADLAGLYGGLVRSASAISPLLVVELARSRIGLLAEEDAVQWIEPALPPLSELALRNDDNRIRTGADALHAAPYNLDGAGVTALVYDSGTARATHQTFGGRLTRIDLSPTSNHATHVAGTVGGSGANSGSPGRAGMAPGATLLSASIGTGGSLPSGFLYTNPVDLEAEYSLAINAHDADLANNSLGTNVTSNGFDCAIQGDYGVTCALIDSIVRGSLGRPFPSVWANGNERVGGRCHVEGHGEYYSIAPPAGAKNHLTVGALNSNDDSMTSFSSWGPTDDGRMKPDISGPGCQSAGNDSGVTSSTSASDTSYGAICGTSMASPTVAGLAALILQDFRAQFPGLSDPRSSTLRALLAHTSEDVFNPGPDYMSGYGSVRVLAAVDHMRTGALQESVVGQGETYSTVLGVDGGSSLRVTIAWDDAPGTPNAAVSLVNDLDLRLIDPAGVIHHPWSLDPSSPADDAVRTGPNTRDNIEQVMVGNPLPGAWTVEVVGADVPQGPQTFSLVGAGRTAGLGITLSSQPPTIVPPGVPIELELTVIPTLQELVPGTTMIHYSLDGGAFISAAAEPLGDDRYSVTVPAPACGQIPRFYFAATGAVSGTLTLPIGAPGDAYSVGVGVDTVPFADSFQTDTGWAVVNTPTGSGAFTGAWERGIPAGGVGAPPTDADGDGWCYVTDNRPSNVDVDNGSTSLVSPIMDASGGLATISYSRWFYNSNAALDVLLTEISGDGGETWHHLESVGPQSLGGWAYVTHDIPPPLATDGFRIRFSAGDLGVQAIVEAAVDGVRLDVAACVGGPACPADYSGDGLVNSGDISAFVTAWIASIQLGDLVADFNGDLAVNSGDISAFLTAWLDAVQSGC